MKVDSIAKEEFWRTIGGIYWVFCLSIGFLILFGYLPLPQSSMFPLALIPTVTYYLVMVWYRRKEHLVDPSLINILCHALRSGEHGEEKTRQRRVVTEKMVDAILAAAIFLIYLYASLAYSINQIYWLPVSFIIVLLLIRIVFTDGGERRITVARSAVFYLVAAGLLLLRYLALGYPVVSLLQAIALVGIVFFAVLFIWKRRRALKGKD